MSSNDMPVIFYKVLSYLYEQIKEGTWVNYKDLQEKSGVAYIPVSYFRMIIHELLHKDFAQESLSPKTGNSLTITWDGYCFLENHANLKEYI
jgi:hypothetical protein